MVESLDTVFGKQGDFMVSPLPKRLHNSFNALIETKGSADAVQIETFLEELVDHATTRSLPKPVFFDSMHLKSKSGMGSRYRVRPQPACSLSVLRRRWRGPTVPPLLLLPLLHRRCPSCSTRTATSRRSPRTPSRRCGRSSTMPKRRPRWM